MLGLVGSWLTVSKVVTYKMGKILRGNQSTANPLG